jgi:hypothetical protein
MSTFLDELEANARGRFVRWDPALWRELLAGPAPLLGHTLSDTAAPAEVEELVRAYLRLSAEAIGLGYLYPATAGRQNFFTLAWMDLVPRLLAGVAPEERADVLAQLWNLGENLESAPPWVQRIFHSVGKGLTSLSGIEARLRATAEAAMEEPKEKLGQRSQPYFVHLAREDSRFLPGALHFLAPTVLCVHDRHRHAVGGREASTQGLWLKDGAPMLLGAMGCREKPGLTREQTPPLTWLSWNDPRVEQWLSSVVNDWRAAATMETSQFVVVLLPA